MGMMFKNNLNALVIGLVLVTSGIIGFIIFSEHPDMRIYEETVMDFEVLVSVRNTGENPAYDIPLRLALPVDRPPSQFLQKIEISAVPPEFRTNDSLGNEFIHYTIQKLEPQDEKNYTFNVSLKILSIDFYLKNISEDSSENLTSYLVDSPYTNINEPAIQRLADEISRGSGNRGDIAWNTYEWIIENIRYQQIPGENDAITTLKIKEGGSAEFGNLFVALMRASGIPARRVSGWGRRFEKGEELFMQRFSHGWAEFYMPGHGWIPVDPAWGQTNKFDNFAKTHPSHIILTRGEDIHYLRRGGYKIPEGETEIETDYKLKVKDITARNVSLRRDLIRAGIFMMPLFFAVYVLYKKKKLRRVADIQ